MGLNDSALGKKAAAPKAPAVESGEKPTVKTSSKSDVVDQILASTGYQPDTSVPAGSLSDSVAFEICLGDPSVPDNATLKGADGKEEKRTYPRIIGYRFKALKDVTVPDFGTTSRFNGVRLMNAENTNNWIQVKAGETFDLTRVEVGALLSQPGFGGTATGGENPVRLQIAFNKMKGDVAEINDAENLPGVALALVNGGSIKELGFVNVLEYQSNSTEDNKYAEGTRTLNPEFEGTKFAPRAMDVARRKASAPRSRKASTADTKKYAAFDSLIKKIGASQG